ncbi:hypothetical protein TNCV_2381891 [Trichonephila clavipes]|nr:hypothetical protein TNCV_2381891 [Trichonephila clavipes]
MASHGTPTFKKIPPSSLAVDGAERFVSTNPAESHHLPSVSRILTRFKPYSNKELADLLNVYGTVDCKGYATQSTYQITRPITHKLLLLVSYEAFWFRNYGIFEPAFLCNSKSSLPFTHPASLSSFGSSPGEAKFVSKCIESFWHEGTLISHRAASPLVRLADGKECWEAPNLLQGDLLQNRGGNWINRNGNSMVIKLRLTTCVHLALYRNSIRGLRSVTVR